MIEIKKLQGIADVESLPLRQISRAVIGCGTVVGVYSHGIALKGRPPRLRYDQVFKVGK